MNFAEAIDVSTRVHGLAEAEIADAVRALFGTNLELELPQERDAWRAADLRARLYRRRDRPLSLADCFLLASAHGQDSIATADPALAEAARAEGIAVVALPDSSGARP